MRLHPRSKGSWPRGGMVVRWESPVVSVPLERQLFFFPGPAEGSRQLGRGYFFFFGCMSSSFYFAPASCLWSGLVGWLLYGVRVLHIKTFFLTPVDMRDIQYPSRLFNPSQVQALWSQTLPPQRLYILCGKKSRYCNASSCLTRRTRHTTLYNRKTFSSTFVAGWHGALQ